MSAQFILDTGLVRAFVAEVEQAIAGADSPDEACEAIRPRFSALLADPEWLPSKFQAAAPESGMGGGIGQWLLYRADEGSLSLFSLVVPPRSETPIHDHLAWGLVGLYRGTQDEEIYAPRPMGSSSSGDGPSVPVISTLSFPHVTTSIVCGQPLPRRLSRSTCLRTTPAASGATPMTRAQARLGPFVPATSMSPATAIPSRRRTDSGIATPRSLVPE